MNPLVTAVCITRNRREWIPKCIDCYQRQTYSPKQLVIVADGDMIDDLVPTCDGTIASIRINSGMMVGEKRNYANAQAVGDIICHWDDDDWSAPARMEMQVERLVLSGKQVTGYRDMIFTTWDGARWLYEGRPGYVLGTSLAYWRDWWKQHPFELAQVGEDTSFVNCAMLAGELDIDARTDLMTASIHNSNTWPKFPVEGHHWRQIKTAGAAV